MNEKGYPISSCSVDNLGTSNESISPFFTSDSTLSGYSLVDKTTQELGFSIEKLLLENGDNLYVLFDKKGNEVSRSSSEIHFLKQFMTKPVYYISEEGTNNMFFGEELICSSKSIPHNFLGVVYGKALYVLGSKDSGMISIFHGDKRIHRFISYLAYKVTFENGIVIISFGIGDTVNFKISDLIK